jgi:hypothetical protein
MVKIISLKGSSHRIKGISCLQRDELTCHDCFDWKIRIHAVLNFIDNQKIDAKVLLSGLLARQYFDGLILQLLQI